MSVADDLWLGATAAQRNAQHVARYSAAIYSSAVLQGWKFGVEAPLVFWRAMSRAGGPAAHVAPTPAEAAPLSVTDPVETIADASQNPHLLDAPRDGVADDLTALSGIGAKLAETLNEFGIYHFDQLASLNEDGIAWLNAQQPGFKALAARFDLVAQASARAR